MHKKDFFPSYCFHISRFQIIFPCRDIGPATATLDPRPRLWTRDRDIGPATATLDPRPATRDPRLLVKLGTRQGLKHDSTHTEDRNFQLDQIIFSGVQGTQSRLGEQRRGSDNVFNPQRLPSERDNINNKGRESIAC